MDHMGECTQLDGEKFSYQQICNEMLNFILAVSEQE